MTDDSSLAESVQCEGDSRTGVTGQRVSLAENPLLLTVSSAVAFLIAGTWAWSLEFVLVLFPVLVLHEVGHLVAMKAFGYRNIRFFFVPLLGAAVAGRSETGSFHQQVTVCLAGPIPGILIALLLWCIGLSTANELLFAVTVVLLVVNGLNLLPVFPLDGGQLIQTIFLANRPKLKFAYRFGTLLILIAVSIAIKSWLLAAVALLFATGLKSAFHFSRIHARLLQSATDSNQPPQQPLCENLILQEVRNEFPGALLTKPAAQEWTHRMQQACSASPPGLPVIVALCIGILLLMSSSGGVLFELLKTIPAKTNW